jgi:hypothetical protein
LRRLRKAFKKLSFKKLNKVTDSGKVMFSDHWSLKGKTKQGTGNKQVSALKGVSKKLKLFFPRNYTTENKNTSGPKGKIERN